MALVLSPQTSSTRASRAEDGRLSLAFGTTSELPLSMPDLRLREGVKDPNPENKGLGTLQLEFWYVFNVLRFPVDTSFIF